jgi:hypothetical protein
MGSNKQSKGYAKRGFIACLTFSWLFCMFEFFQPTDRSQRSEESDAANLQTALNARLLDPV